MKIARRLIRPTAYTTRKLDIANRPRLWLGKVEWEGPIVEWPPKGRKSLFFAGEEREDDGYLREIFARFLPLAYRRPVTNGGIGPRRELDAQDQGRSEPVVYQGRARRREERPLLAKVSVSRQRSDALARLSAVERLSRAQSRPVSADVHVRNPDAGSEVIRRAGSNVEKSGSSEYLRIGVTVNRTAQETASKSSSVPQRVDGWQLASRLSYLLWSSAPDEELYHLAAQNKLRDPAVLRAQVKRMIADPKAWEFVRSFAGQWLGVRNFENGNPPNRDFYKFYDDALRDSSKREPLEFFNEVLKHDLPITDFLDSDFLVINERLAKHYGIDGVEGDQFRRVPAPADDRRGGVLGMSGILTYLADGTRTLPVRRATWVLDTLWNQPVPPPPPNAGSLPAIAKGKAALSVRARLEQHRTTENCASCHARVDPFGMALENYDAIGEWRDRQNGEGMRGDKDSPALDVSGKLPDGTEFKTVQEYKAALLAHKQNFIKGFTEKLLCYALGRPIAYRRSYYGRSNYNRRREARISLAGDHSGDRGERLFPNEVGPASRAGLNLAPLVPTVRLGSPDLLLPWMVGF